MPASSQQIIVGDNQRGGFQIPAGVFRQVAGKEILYIAQIHAEQVQVVFTDFAHDLVHLASPQHGVVSFAVSDAYTARVGEKFGQFLELLFAQTVQHTFQFRNIIADASLGVAVHILINEVNIFFSIRHVVVLLILP